MFFVYALFLDARDCTYISLCSIPGAVNHTTDSCETFEKKTSQELFHCNDGPYGRCIIKERVCNGKHDCLNGEDENETICCEYCQFEDKLQLHNRSILTCYSEDRCSYMRVFNC